MFFRFSKINPTKTDSSLILTNQKFVQRTELKLLVLPEWVLIERSGSGSIYSHPDLVYNTHLGKRKLSGEVVN